MDGPKTPLPEGDFFRQPPREQIDLKHPLVRLADLIDRDRLNATMSANFVPHRGRPATSPRLIAGLLDLQTKPPVDRSSLTRWRKR